MTGKTRIVAVGRRWRGEALVGGEWVASQYTFASRRAAHNAAVCLVLAAEEKP